MTTSEEPWPALPYPELAPAVDYVRRLVQIAGKYTLDQLFEPAWGTSSLQSRCRDGDILADGTVRAKESAPA